VKRRNAAMLDYFDHGDGPPIAAPRITTPR
jgi:hypothetical protein